MTKPLLNVVTLSNDATWDDSNANPLALGCPTCPDFAACGGLHTADAAFDCGQRCKCADPLTCDIVCRKKPAQFRAQRLEINGFSLDNVPRAPVLQYPDLPLVVPLLDHGYKRTGTLNEGVVAVPLSAVYNKGTGLPFFCSKAELCAHFRISLDATIIASGVARDFRIEPWWRLATPQFLKRFKSLGIALFTVPNFSVFSDVPRTDNLHSIKRIALAFSAMVNAGLPTALHLNARTERDYANWTRFLLERPEVQVVSFEFGTGAGSEGRIDNHVAQLCALAEAVGRPLTLVLRGGLRRLTALKQHFARVVVLDTVPFAKTRQRQRAVVKDNGFLTWPSAAQEFGHGKPLDLLLAHNIEMSRRAIIDPPEPFHHSRAAAGSRGRRKKTLDADGQTRQLRFPSDPDCADASGEVAA